MFPLLNNNIYSNNYIEEMEEQLNREYRDQSRSSVIVPSETQRHMLQSFSLSTSCLFTNDTDYVVKLVENLLTFLRILSKAKDVEDCFLAVIAFAQFRANTSLTSTLLNKWEETMGVHLQDSDGISFAYLKGVLGQYDVVKKLPVFVKLYKFTMYCIGTSLFEKLGVKFDTKRYLNIEKAAIKKEFYLGPDFIHCLLDTTLFLCESGYQCMKTGSLDPFLHHDGSYSEWIARGEELRIQARYITNPEPHGFTVFDFLSRLDDNIEKGKVIIKFLDRHDTNATIIRRILSDLEVIRSDCKTKRLAQQERKAPFAVLVHGGSSVAKSQFTKLLFYHYGKMFNLPIGDEYKYSRNAFDQYWTNFNTSQWCLQLDDIAYLHPNSSVGCDPSLIEMLQVINNVPYVPTQADLADKGKTPVRARFVIATTNTENLNAETYFACPLAAQRRLPYIFSLRPKPEYVRDDGPMIDPAKLPPSNPGEYPDFWEITVKKVVANTSRTRTHMGQTASYKTVNIFSNIYDFLLWFNSIAESAEVEQTQAMKCDEDMKTVELCAHKIPVLKCTVCSELQSLDIDVFDTPWIRRVSENLNIASESIDIKMQQNIWRSYFSMNIFSMLIAFFCFGVLWLMSKSEWFKKFMIFMYGRWCVVWIISHLLHIPETRALSVKILGYRAYNSIRSGNMIAICGSIVTAISIIKASRYLINQNFFFGGKNFEVQGLTAEVGTPPESKNDKHENVWYNDTFECTSFDVTPSILSKNNWTIDDMEKYIQPNLISYKIRVRDGDMIREKHGRGICIGGHTYLVNNHCIQYDAFEMDIIFQSAKEGLSQNFTTLITSYQLTRYPLKDQCYINIRSVPPKRDIRNLFAKTSFEGRFDGSYISRNQSGAIVKQNFKCPRLIKNFEFNCPEKLAYLKTNIWDGIVDTPTEVGDCGTTLIVKSSLGPMILGIHALGTMSNRSSAVSVTFEDVSNLNLNIISDNTPRLQVGSYGSQLVSLNVKATCRYIQKGVMQVYGSLSGFRTHPKSRVAKTILSDCAVRDGFSRETGPPVMNSYEPWRHALLAMSQPVSHLDENILTDCVSGFTNDILKGLTKKDLAELKVYDLNTAINGMPGLAYVDKMPRSTSAGYPFRKSKKYFLEAVEPFGEWQHPVKITPEIENEMDYIMECYEQGKVYRPIFTASLKDEPTSFKKIASGKTRVFCGAPLPWSLVVRMYLLPIIRLIQKNRELFESGPGTIAQSTEWDALYKTLVKFGLDRIVAGDYELFDKTMPAKVILAAFDVLIAILKAAGWTEAQMRVVMCIAEDTAFPTVDFRGELLRVYGSNPSGHPLTVIINGIANCLYVRYCYAINHPEGHCRDFKQNVSLMTYGDDMIMGVSPKCTWLNHTIMQKTLADVGIKFTMADKNAPSVPFIHIDEATFLRRKWRYEPCLGVRVCPIEHASIDKMLTMCVLSKSVSPEIQAVAVLDTACREYFWYGKDIFVEKRKLFYSWISELDLEMYLERELPTWEQLVNEFETNSQLRLPGEVC